MYVQSHTDVQYIVIVEINVEVIWTNHPEMTGVVTSMQVFYYGNTGFLGPKICYACYLQGYATFTIVPKTGGQVYANRGFMLIEGLC